MALAPAPLMTTFRSSIFFPVTSQALSSAAPEIIAVPCWSSWKTGMSSSRLSASSTSKHSGALMSSRLIPPNVGAMNRQAATISSTVLALISISNTSTSAKRLKRTPLPSITGLDASGPLSPNPNIAVPLDTTATRLARAVNSNAVSGSRSISRTASATPGE